MTPDERQLLTSFLQDLAQARTGQKDPEAASLIAQAMNANPDATYLLVQHTVISDQALHAAQARIAELEAQLASASQAQQTSFLGGASPWRQAQTSVPPSPPPGAGYYPPPQQAYAPPPDYAPPPGPFSMGGGLGSFLRTAGTTAAGVAGGEMLFEGLSGLFGGHHRGFGGGQGFFGGDQPQVVNNYFDDSVSDRERDEIADLDDDRNN